jgi:hypothetical protein
VVEGDGLESRSKCFELISAEILGTRFAAKNCRNPMDLGVSGAFCL